MIIAATPSGGGGSAYAWIRVRTTDTNLLNQVVEAAIDGKILATEVLSVYKGAAIATIPVPKKGTYTVTATNKYTDKTGIGTVKVTERGKLYDTQIQADASTLIIDARVSKTDDARPVGTYKLYQTKTVTGDDGEETESEVVLAEGSLSETDYTEVVSNGSGAAKCDITFTNKDNRTVTASVTLAINESTTLIEYESVPITTFADATDQDFADIAEALQSGAISTDDLPWAVGDERTFTLTETDGTTTDTTWVILDTGANTGYTFEDGNQVSYLIGMKEPEAETRAMSTKTSAAHWTSTKNTDNAPQWSNSLIRDYLDGDYVTKMPASVANAFKKFKVTTGLGDNRYVWDKGDLYYVNLTSDLETVSDVFALPATKEIYGEYSGQTKSATVSGKTYYSSHMEAASTAEQNALIQFEYYKSSSNIPTITSYSRSPVQHFRQTSGNTRYFYFGFGSFVKGTTIAPPTTKAGVCPFGCI